MICLSTHFQTGQKIFIVCLCMIIDLMFLTLKIHSGDIWLLFLVEKLGLSDVVKVVTLVLRRDIIAARSSSAEKYSTWRTPRKPPKQRSLPTTTTATRTTSYFVFFEAMAPLQYIQHQLDFDAGIPPFPSEQHFVAESRAVQSCLYTPAACCWPFVWNFSLDKNT